MFGRRGRHLSAVVDHFDVAAVLQAVSAFQHHPVAGCQALLDHGVVAVGVTDHQRTDLDLLVAIEHVDEGAIVAELNRRRWRQHHVMQGVGQQVHIHELVGEQRLVLVIEARLEFQGAGGDVDLVVQALQHAVGFQGHVAAVPGFYRQLVAGVITRQHGFQGVFRQREDHADGLGLGDHRQEGGVVGGDEVAHVHLAQADTPGNRGADLGKFEVELGVIHRALVGLDRALVLQHQRFGGVQGLLGDTVLGIQVAITLHVDLGVFQLGLVLQQRALGLEQGILVTARVDFRQQVTGLDHLPFFKGDLDQLSPTRLRTLMVFSAVTVPSAL